jgi:glucokinase
MKEKTERLILAGDVGGSKTTLALFYPAGRGLRPRARAVFASREFPSLAAVLERFLAGSPPGLTRAVFGIAGPVHAGRVHATNLPWRVNASSLSRILGGIPVRLLNDLEALARALPSLRAGDFWEINAGLPDRRGPLAVLAPGTGLGEAILARCGGAYRALPSEGGHADFAPADELQDDLLAYLRPRFGHVSYERVCSGGGLPNLYGFFKESGRFQEPRWLGAQLAESKDPTPVIVRCGLEGTSRICRATLDLFVAILAAEAGNLALKTLPRGGLYLGGGMPPRVLPLLRAPGFMKTFTAKGRFTGLLKRIPVRVITHPDPVLIGAALSGDAMPENDQY